MSYLFGSGWWVVWYGLLWLSLIPYVVMTAALTRASPNESMLPMENAFAVSAMSVFVLMGATAISGYLWTAGGSSGGLWPYVRNIGAAILVALIVGFAFIFGAGYYAVTPKQPMVNRWAAQILCLASASFLLWVCIHATWRFRHR
ncbi:MAG TPA: hypothetical protein VM076_17345 [Gemmatimonadaceae bacterium]|nr:hypothetical protein [Gemmatimonadaceae bacterium]